MGRFVAAEVGFFVLYFCAFVVLYLSCFICWPAGGLQHRNTMAESESGTLVEKFAPKPVVGQGETWHETEHRYSWILVGVDLYPVASMTVLLTETCRLVDL